ncbi:hypothetical protein ACIA5C_04495 [Actinoplanes sp. NPDC051343]|uniref:hypothetical protein n=1 Tax=Actinoplanes sp. NPDC051343 TaxID=3363906 RepID=UPI0037BD9ACD
MVTAELPDRTTGQRWSTVLRLAILAGVAVVGYLLLSAGAARADDKPAVPGLEDVTGAVSSALDGAVPGGSADRAAATPTDRPARGKKPEAAGSTTEKATRVAGSTTEKTVRAAKSTAGKVVPAGKAAARKAAHTAKSARTRTRVATPEVVARTAKVVPTLPVEAAPRLPTVNDRVHLRATKAVRTTTRNLIAPVTKTRQAVRGPLTTTLQVVPKPVTDLVATTSQRVSAPLTTMLGPIRARLTTTLHTATTALPRGTGPLTTTLHTVTRPLTQTARAVDSGTAPLRTPFDRVAAARPEPAAHVVQPDGGGTARPPVAVAAAVAMGPRRDMTGDLSPLVVPAGPVDRAAARTAAEPTTTTAAGNHDRTARPSCAHRTKASGHSDATPGRPSSAPRPAPPPGPDDLALLNSSATAGAGSAPGLWAITSAACLPGPAAAGTAALDSVYHQGRHLGCTPLPG